MRKVELFDRGKHENSMRKRSCRAPDYVVEAYLNGHTKVVNTYYTEKYTKRLGRGTTLVEGVDQDIIELAKTETDKRFIQEALSKKDLDFLKAFFQITNQDIFSGSKLPPNAGELIKQATTKNLQVTDIVKKLK